MQILSITLTFDREGFTPSAYLNDTQREDRIEVVSLNRCWYLAAEAEQMARKYDFTEDNQAFLITDVQFLIDFYFMLKEEIARSNAGLPLKSKTIWEADAYGKMLSGELKNLEWLLFYLTDRIAAAQLFEQLSPYCFESAETRNNWLAMCEAWGNDKPDAFKIIFSVY